jgi:hypothetical protein
VHGAQQVGFARAGGAATLVNAADCAIGTQDNGAAGCCFKVCDMPDTNTGHICECMVHRYGAGVGIGVGIIP